MKNPPTVSVFVPYYNDRNFLPQCIESILAQTFKDFELVLLNHATTDDCRRIAHSFDDPRIVHIDMPSNLGAGSGMLILEFLKAASGKFAKLFCADDLMRPDCLEKLVGYMLKHPETDVKMCGKVELSLRRIINKISNSVKKRLKLPGIKKTP